MPIISIYSRLESTSISGLHFAIAKGRLSQILRNLLAIYNDQLVHGSEIIAQEKSIIVLWYHYLINT